MRIRSLARPFLRSAGIPAGGGAVLAVAVYCRTGDIKHSVAMGCALAVIAGLVLHYVRSILAGLYWFGEFTRSPGDRIGLAAGFLWWIPGAVTIWKGGEGESWEMVAATLLLLLMATFGGCAVGWTIGRVSALGCKMGLVLGGVSLLLVLLLTRLPVVGASCGLAWRAVSVCAVGAAAGGLLEVAARWLFDRSFR